jgi:hypothetical protein
MVTLLILLALLLVAAAFLTLFARQPRFQFQFRLWHLFGLTLYVAILAAMLSEPSPAWAILGRLIQFAALAIAVLGICYRRDAARAFSVGFIAFGVAALPFWFSLSPDGSSPFFSCLVWPAFALLGGLLGRWFHATGTSAAPMAPCPDCGRRLSMRAAACPHCGCPVDSGSSSR